MSPSAGHRRDRESYVHCARAGEMCVLDLGTGSAFTAMIRKAPPLICGCPTTANTLVWRDHHSDDAALHVRRQSTGVSHVLPKLPKDTPQLGMWLNYVWVSRRTRAGSLPRGRRPTAAL